MRVLCKVILFPLGPVGTPFSLPKYPTKYVPASKIAKVEVSEPIPTIVHIMLHGRVRHQMILHPVLH